jgi:hypothetical protein
MFQAEYFSYNLTLRGIDDVAQRKRRLIRLALELLRINQATTQQAPDLEEVTDYLRYEKAAFFVSIICVAAVDDH